MASGCLRTPSPRDPVTTNSYATFRSSSRSWPRIRPKQNSPAKASFAAYLIIAGVYVRWPQDAVDWCFDSLRPPNEATRPRKPRRVSEGNLASAKGAKSTSPRTVKPGACLDNAFVSSDKATPTFKTEGSSNKFCKDAGTDRIFFNRNNTTRS